MADVRPSLCPLCEAACGLDIHVKDEAVTLIRGNRDDLFSGGYLCPKGTSLRELQTDPDRLRRPLVKRDGAFVEVSFDEAFAAIEAGLSPVLERHGRHASGLVIGNPAVHRTGLVLYALDLAAALGSPNVFSAATLDQMPKHLTVGHMYGDFYSVPVPDLERTDLLLVVGANPIVSNGSMWSVPDFKAKAQALRARGGRMVTVDPRRTETADVGDAHVPIRPGTDAFLLAAMVNVLAADDLIDLGAAGEVIDRSELQQVVDVVAPFTPQRVGPTCGIEPGVIAQLAADLASAPSAAVYGRIGTCHQVHATVVNWLIEVLNIITGNLDRAGGLMWPRPAAFAANTEAIDGNGTGIATGTYASRVSGAPEVMNQFPLACLAEEIETPGDGQIRSLITLAANPVLSAPEGPRVAAALDDLDFMVSLDIYVNETTQYADVILPSPSPLEESHYDVFFSLFAHRNVARYTPAVLAAPKDMLADWETMVRLIAVLTGEGASAAPHDVDDRLLRQMLVDNDADDPDMVIELLGDRVGAERRLDLALRTGPYGDWFGLNPDGLTLSQLADHPEGVDFGPLEPRLPEVLRTGSGNIDIAPPVILDALREAEAELDKPAPAAVLVGRRHLRSNNSWMHNLRVLTKGKPRCTLLVHPDDAAAWSLIDGGQAVVASPSTNAEVEVAVVFDDAMAPGVVSLPHGWGHDWPDSQLGVAAERPGVNMNALIPSDRRDPLSGNAALSGIEVTVTNSEQAQ